METFGSLLRKKREEKKLSIRQLAKYSGVSPAYISQLENNYRKNPTPHVLRALCDGLGIDYEQFLLELNQLSKEELKEREAFKAYVSSGMRKKAGSDASSIDLDELFEENVDIFYKGRKLGHEEKEKIKTMLEMLLE